MQVNASCKLQSVSADYLWLDWPDTDAGVNRVFVWSSMSSLQNRTILPTVWITTPSEVHQVLRDVYSPSAGSGSVNEASWLLTGWLCLLSSSTCLHTLQVYPSCTWVSGSVPSCFSQSTWTHLKHTINNHLWQPSMPQSRYRHLPKPNILFMKDATNC